MLSALQSEQFLPAFYQAFRFDNQPQSYRIYPQNLKMLLKHSVFGSALSVEWMKTDSPHLVHQMVMASTTR